MIRRPLALVSLGLLVAVAAACSPRTTGTPLGDLVLTTSFPDAQDLTVGHAVQVSGVQVGTVTGLKLDGYRAVATMSIQTDRKIPRGTVAALTRASLLGEHLIDLRLPKGFDGSSGPFLRKGDTLPSTAEQDLEQLADKAADVLGAIQANDLGGILEATSVAMGGKGPKLNRIISDLSAAVRLLSDQRGNLAAAVDGIGRLGSELADGSDDVAVLLDDLTDASRALAVNREKAVATVRELTRFARGLNDVVLEPHGERLSTLIEQLDPIAATLAANRDKLGSLIEGLNTFMSKIDDTVRGGRLLQYIWFGGLVMPRPNGAAPNLSAFNLLRPVP